MGRVPDPDDLTARKFGEWTVIGYAGKNDRGERTWYCVCGKGDAVIREKELLKLLER